MYDFLGLPRRLDYKRDVKIENPNKPQKTHNPKFGIFSYLFEFLLNDHVLDSYTAHLIFCVRCNKILSMAIKSIVALLTNLLPRIVIPSEIPDIIIKFLWLP